MDNLEGMLLVPPERGQILGRAVWKLRYVVVGRRNTRGGPSQSQFISNGRNNSLGGSRSFPKLPIEESCILIYKHKDDTEPIQQWPVNSITDCQVQQINHRKQGPVLPTLVISVADKEKKRRSSRAAGLISSSKEASATTLWFRTPPDDHHVSLHEWARNILARKSPMSPESPMSPQFSNPFATMSRDASDYFSRPTSGNKSGRSDPRSLQHKSSINTQSTTTTTTTTTRERPLTFSSESLSLRSKRSDVSSPSSNNYPIQQMNFPIPGQHYTTVLPTDLPSPVNTTGDYQGEFIEGWTSAQGRSSTMSSPIRGRSSIGSQPPHPSIAAIESSSPPGPRETILDRAFQMRCIPGSEREVPGEEKLSSLARFDALMREADDKMKQRAEAERAQQLAMRSAFEASDSSSQDDESDSDDLDEDAYGGVPDRRGPALIPSTTQRALQFIADRRDPAPLSPSSRSSVSRTPMIPQSPPIRPHTAHAKTRPNPTQRTNSTPQMIANMARLELAAPPSKVSDDSSLRSNGDKRLSTSSTATKRLSFTEFTKRLSSTSSLLFVQTNASGRSSRRSSEIDLQPSPLPCGTLNPQRIAVPTRDQDRDQNSGDVTTRCGWRNSVGVVSRDGTFF
ncbi:hypothetical protein V3481_005325 [Fusarium oxysporum f. sp. vasinfectum]|uniref:Uncharacterized protein n=2 Tax=Fusarium oxysporum f. sp. vasinfectum 25433 TaxID=1089449 RepID=X0MD13_FUSOX|nr:hypothetical protein FOTG_00366 [Fusarium oxysporum f. sp. vasinfectum 25433]EXM36064.1 hypothetical protein FOTG_00366 [Fusarium oxysporum f. sp. vasinfectum 25433]